MRKKGKRKNEKKEMFTSKVGGRVNLGDGVVGVDARALEALASTAVGLAPLAMTMRRVQE